MATYKTITELINRDDRYDVSKITFFTQTEDGSLIIPDTNLFRIYMPFIRDYIRTYKVTKEQINFYRYKPYLLSNDIYGTPKLAWLILLLNDRECASKFYLKSTAKLVPPGLLEQLYTEITTRSTDRLEENQIKYRALIGQDL